MSEKRKKKYFLYRKTFFLAVLFVVFGFTTACQKEQGEQSLKEDEYNIYYLNSEETKLVAEVYKAQATSVTEKADELLKAMDNSPKDLSLRKVKPEEVVISNIDTDKKGQLTINFSSGYKKMGTVREVLYRAAVVKTLEQIDGVEFIQFYVDGQPLTDQNDKVIGFMSGDNFIDNTGKETNYGQNVSMVLYFANADGTKLKEVHVTKEYDGTITIAQLVIQQLLEGTEAIDGLDENCYCDTIPEGTQLIKTTTKDGICYVDFSSEFLNKREGLTDETAIYSVVNSLVELSSVNKVQFTIDGLQVEKYGDGTSFADLFERNLDIVE